MCSQWILEVQLLRFVGTSSLVPMSMLFERDHKQISTSVEVEDVTSDLEIDDFDVKSNATAASMPMLDIESENSEPYEPADNNDDDSDDNDHDNDTNVCQRANDMFGICESFAATPNPGNSIASIEVIGATEVIDRI